MEAALFASALALGLAGAPHCVAMCAAPCAAATAQGGARAQAAFHVMRAAGYGVAGALAAASVNSLGALGALSPVFKPLWSFVHAAALALGLWLAVTGRQPAWMGRMGRQPRAAVAGGSGWSVMQGPGRAAAAGAAWVAWPCGLLQSAILVAALADTPWTGAGVMVVFAAATGLGLSLAPWLWTRVRGMGGVALLSGTAGVRLAGVLLAAAAGWALSSGLWMRFAAYCGW
jgi:uncharacterized protein